MSLSEMLAEISRAENRNSRDNDEDHRRTPADVLCTTLREVAERYVAPCPFKVGDLVTPRPSYNIKGAGEPYIVVEVFETPIRLIQVVEDMSDAASQVFGARFDIRVAHEAGGSLIMHCGESWAYESYTGA